MRNIDGSAGSDLLVSTVNGGTTVVEDVRARSPGVPSRRSISTRSPYYSGYGSDTSTTESRAVGWPSAA